MLIETGRSIPWTFTGLIVSAAFSLPREETMTRELKVTYAEERAGFFRAVLPALGVSPYGCSSVIRRGTHRMRPRGVISGPLLDMRPCPVNTSEE